MVVNKICNIKYLKKVKRKKKKKNNKIINNNSNSNNKKKIKFNLNKKKY